ncbi:hypothetical protein PIB30_030973 [Stylosanthes scabra]|uniref:Uncharacterized protein n=1 Tax=Stylosanthes scabra TaxID=79078 RepID=A0ABU6TBG6_9FABA|nr:hypothetical protein [Stylosanthes scabra]
MRTAPNSFGDVIWILQIHGWRQYYLIRQDNSRGLRGRFRIGLFDICNRGRPTRAMENGNGSLKDLNQDNTTAAEVEDSNNSYDFVHSESNYPCSGGITLRRQTRKC